MSLTCHDLREDAERLVDKVKKLSVAEVMRSIEVTKLPLCIVNNQPCRMYKLKVKLNQPKHVSRRNCEETLRINFLRALEDAIERHVALLSRINGIKSAKNTKAETASEDDASATNPDHDDNHDDHDRDDDDGDDDDDGKDETVDDLGSDYKKQKRQNTDSVEYDESEEEVEEDEEGEETDGEHVMEGKNGKEDESDAETDGEDVVEEQEQEDMSNAEAKTNEEFVSRKFDRSNYVEVKDLTLEAHFRFTNEPEILLAEVNFFIVF